MTRTLPVLLALLALTIDAVAAVKVGDTPRDNFGKDQRGDVINMSDYRGRVVVLTFWASWCGPCRNEMSILENLQNRTGKDQLVVVALNFHEDLDRFRKIKWALRENALTIGYGAGELSDEFDVQSIPHMFLINKEGKIAFIHKGYSERALDGFVREINALLAESPPSDASSPVGKDAANDPRALSNDAPVGKEVNQGGLR